MLPGLNTVLAHPVYQGGGFIEDSFGQVLANRDCKIRRACG